MQSASWLTNMCQPEVFNTSAQPGLTRHGRILSGCESNLNCFKESLHIMSQGERSTQGRMFLIKKKKLSMQVENMLTGGKKILPETPVMTPWQKKNLSTVGVYNMKAAEGLQNPFQIDTQLLRISVLFSPLARSICSTFQCRQHGALLLDASKIPSEKEQLPRDLYTLKHHVIP